MAKASRARGSISDLGRVPPGDMSVSATAEGLSLGHGRFGHVRSGRIPLQKLDRVADGDFARLDDPREHPAPALDLRAEAVAQFVHAMAWIADHRDLEHRLVPDTHLLADRPLLHVRALDGQVLADRARLDTHGLQGLPRDEQPP